MEKKKLIGRAALIAGALAVVFAGMAFVCVVVDRKHRNRSAAEAKRQITETARRSREYLAQVAKQIAKLPVDPAVVGDVESRYFEEYRDVRRFVWAMDNQGGFLFGVPAEAFTRLNQAYDRLRPRIEKQGHYASRQEFLRRLIQEHDQIDFNASEAPSEPGEGEGLVAESEAPEWRLTGEEESRWQIFSLPIKTESGAVLGNLYTKVDMGNIEVPTDRTFADAAEGLAGGMGLTLGFLWFLLPTWVYVDARERGVRRAPLWSFLALISGFLGLIVYLIARPEQPKTLRCPGCEREVNGGPFCPHCGRDLSAVFCPACRYPLKPDWAFCPACRTEIKPQARPIPEAISTED